MKPSMLFAVSFAALAAATVAAAQDRTAEDITRELNGGPPIQAPPQTPPPAPQEVAPVRPEVQAAPVPAVEAQETGETEAAEAPEETAAPAYTVLDAAAVRALPFSLTLPPEFRITTGRPGPDFQVYTIRRGETPFVMIYAGAQSFYPVYSGQEVEAGGRFSILVETDGRRRAVEHLFRRASTPREIHVWVASVATAGDRDQAEAIAQSVDPR